MTCIIGLTGGIGSGKSTVAEMLRTLGAAIIDADEIVHELQASGAPMLEALTEQFGAEILDEQGALRRKQLGAIVFNDPEARRRLGLIVHPEVGREMLRQVQAALAAQSPMVVADIPLLFEGRREGRDTAKLLDVVGVILTWVPLATQIERVMLRDACTREDALARIRSQVPIDEKRELADWVIDNSGSLTETERQVRDLYHQLVSRDGPRDS